METAYANREIDEKFEDIKSQLTRIENQTIKTNGAVANLKLWRAYITGAVATIGFLTASVCVPLLGSFIQSGKF